MFVRLGTEGQLGLSDIGNLRDKVCCRSACQTLPDAQRRVLRQIHFRRLLLDVQTFLPGKTLDCLGFVLPKPGL